MHAMYRNVLSTLVAPATVVISAMFAPAALSDVVHYDVSSSNANGGYNQSGSTSTKRLGNGDDALNLSAWLGDSGSDTWLDNVSSSIREYNGGLGIYRYSDGERCGGSNQQQNCQHTIDNADGYEYLAIESADNTAFSLTDLRFEWTNTEADFSILALDDGKNFSRVSANTTLNDFSLVASVEGSSGTQSNGGWNYDISSITAPNSGTAITSAVWLIAAFNPDLSGGTTVAHPDDGSYTDGFKLAALKIATSMANGGGNGGSNNGGGNGGGEVPVPAPLALFALGFIYLNRWRGTRRVNASDASLRSFC